MKPLNIGIAGLGTVGQGVIEILEKHQELLQKRTGRKLEIGGINARSRHKKRDIDISHYQWFDDPVSLAQSDDIDVYIELIGGEDGVALASVEAALRAGKSVITANKALLAYHGTALSQLAEDHGVSLKYEAAVAGGIPVIKSLGEGLCGNAITRISGILNGTCNYILSRMEMENISYEHVFNDAKALGYLEADPELDVGGIDAAHKLAILTALGFHVQIDFDALEIEGIHNVSLMDIERAGALGYRIKLVCQAENQGSSIRQSVAPTLVPIDSPLGQCMGVSNIVVIEGDAVGSVALKGPGAGRGATASAVIGDLSDIARGNHSAAFGVQTLSLSQNAPSAQAADTPFYVRLMIADQTGALADVARAFADKEISIDQLHQLDHEGDETPLIMVTHETSRSAIDAALQVISERPFVLSPPVRFEIKD